MENNSSVKAGGYLWKGFRFVRLLLIIVAVSWLFKSYLFSVYYIPSGSMSPTLQPGDYVLVSKFPYNLRSPEYYPLSNIPFLSFSVDGMGEVRQGDIVVFDLPVFPTELHPTQKENYVKRNAGLPGDTILIRHDRYLLRKNYTSKRDTNVARRSTRFYSYDDSGKRNNDSAYRFYQKLLGTDYYAGW